MSRIFISYKRVDKEKVFKIKDQIESALGEKCWIDLDGIESDAQFVNVIINAIDRAEIVLFMYSQQHTNIKDFDNDWTIRELSYANSEKKRIILVNLDNSPLIGWFKFMYGQKQQVDARSEGNIGKLIYEMSKWLTPINDNSCIEIYNANGIEFAMVHIEGGCFKMGSDSGETREGPIHNVTLPDYMCGETPVTQSLWQAVMGYNPSYYKGENQPVERVSWIECQEFINKLNEITGREFRLLTEAEWEYAARGGSRSRKFLYSGSDSLHEVAWFADNSLGQPHDVKMKKPNELGIYDMSGNVWEWCHDWFAMYDIQNQSNPQGGKNGSSRIFRGGCFNRGAVRCQISFRQYYSPDCKRSNLGFRLAL